MITQLTSLVMMIRNKQNRPSRTQKQKNRHKTNRKHGPSFSKIHMINAPMLYKNYQNRNHQLPK